MPHDKNGTLLEVGDRVIMEGVVKNITPSIEYCNLTVSLDPMPPCTTPYIVTLNTKQVTKVTEYAKETS